MTDTLLMVFTRNPELGKVKTRLAKTIGPEAALDIYKHLLEHTHNTIVNLPMDKAVFYSVKIRTGDMWDVQHFQKYQQIGEDLGQRMLHAFATAFDKDYKKVLIIGSDLWDIRDSHVEAAVKALDHNDVVFGPAQDGGYYLLGMTQLHPALFKDKPWGTSTVFEKSMQDLQNLDVHLLDELNDIDTFDDLKQYSELLKRIQQ